MFRHGVLLALNIRMYVMYTYVAKSGATLCLLVAFFIWHGSYIGDKKVPL